MEIIFSIDEIQKVAQKIIAENPKKIILFQGNMGVGKTTLTQYVLKTLVEGDEIFSSPTFNIAHEYYSTKLQSKIFHLDLYRLKSASELYDIGFIDMINQGVCLIEWPDIALSFIAKLPIERIININLKFITDSTRSILLDKHL